MKIEGTTYAVNTHIIVNAKREKSLRLSISNQEVPYEGITIILDGDQALAIVNVIHLGVQMLISAMQVQDE